MPPLKRVLVIGRHPDLAKQVSTAHSRLLSTTAP